MNELVLNLNTKLNFVELISYFSIELVCIFGIICNIVIYHFIARNLKLKRVSDILTCLIFCINSLILTGFLFQKESFSLAKDLIVFNNTTSFMKLFINLFALFFVIATYKFTRKSKHKVPIINSILILIILISGLILSSDNFTFIYVLLECLAISLYKYASISSINKKKPYSVVYITISFSATILFVTFYLLDYLVDDMLQKSLMQSCIALSLLLKIGLFPIFNYSIDKNCRSNISYSILLFCLLPFVGALGFSKIMSICMFNEICQLSISIITVLCAFCASLSCFKTKNITGYLINLGQFYTCFFILNTMYSGNFNPKFIIILMCILLGLYSMVRIYKNSQLKSAVFSFLIIFSSILIPVFGFNMLINIYTFDKTGFLAINTFVFCNVLLIVKALKNIESFYKIKN